MKKVMALGILIFALALSACSGPKAAQPEEGYTPYENTEAGYKIQYPEEYTFAESGMADSAKAAALEMLPEDMRAAVDLNSVQAIWQIPDTNNTINLVLSPASGTTQDALKSADVRETIEASIATQLGSMFQGFSITKHMEGKTLGSQYFIVYTGSYTIGGVELFLHQAITVGGGSLYTFTLTCGDGQDTLNLLVTPFETMLSTLEFT